MIKYCAGQYVVKTLTLKGRRHMGTNRIAAILLLVGGIAILHLVYWESTRKVYEMIWERMIEFCKRHMLAMKICLVAEILLIAYLTQSSTLPWIKSAWTQVSPSGISWYYTLLIPGILIVLICSAFVFQFLTRNSTNARVARALRDGDSGVKADPVAKTGEGTAVPQKPEGKWEKTLRRTKSAFTFMKDAWFVRAFLYVFLWYFLLVDVFFYYLQPYTPTWLHITKWLHDRPELYYAIPFAIFLAVFFFNFKYRWLSLVGASFLLVVGIAVAHETGGIAATERWVEKRYAEKKAERATPKSWELQYDLALEDPRRHEPRPHITHTYHVTYMRDDPAVFEIVVEYPHKYGTKQVRLVWDKTINPDYGTWQQMDPLDGGTWSLRPDPSGVGYVGTYTYNRLGQTMRTDLRLIPKY